MGYEQIFNWTAKRAGGRITITGVNDQGQPRKVVGVDSIDSSPGGPMAIDKNGTHYCLMV